MVQASILYNVVRKWTIISSIGLFLPMLKLDRLLSRLSKLLNVTLAVSGPPISIALELVPPLTFISAFISSPLSFTFQPDPPLRTPQVVLAALYVLHYANRVSAYLRSPNKSMKHTPSTLVSSIFHALHGWVLGAYLTSPFARLYLNTSFTFTRPSFYLGIALWSCGFIGDLFHTEVVSTMHLKAKSNDEQNKNTLQSETIPHGGLFRYISYPAYLCEWVEWLGFALASSPLPPVTIASILYWMSLKNIIHEPAYLFAPNLAPPFIFLIAQVMFMLPNACRGHRQYQERMGGRYPKERRAVIPFVL